MFKKVVILALFAQFTFSSTAFGWGRKGHDIVVEIASRHLTPEAQDAVDEILEGRSLVYYSAWMDQIRSLPEYQYTASWHYTNIDEGEEYQSISIAEGGDVYTAVEDAIDKLSHIDQLEDNDKKFFLRSLIHFVGDIHCPMHAGRKVDRGGGLYNFTWLGEDVNLHGIWDSGLINSSRTWSYTEWADNIDTEFCYNKNYDKYASTEPIEWLYETVENAKKAYAYTPENSHFDSCGDVGKYVYDNYSILESQLLKAGYRLSSLLNTIFK